jgi:hypothetical protein
LFSGFYGNIFHLRTNRECRDLANLSIRDFWNVRGQGIRYPSQALYIYYFIKLMRKMMSPCVNYLPPMPHARRMWLKRVTLYGIPDFGSGNCTPFLQVLPSPWQHHQTSLLYNSSWDQPQFATYEADPHGSICFETNCLIQGDITIRCFHASSGGLLGKNVSQIFHFVFHTDFLGKKNLKHSKGIYRLLKHEIDDANLNRRFLEEFHVDCYLAAQDQQDDDEAATTTATATATAATATADVTVTAYHDFDRSTQDRESSRARVEKLEFADDTMAFPPQALARSGPIGQTRNQNSTMTANSASMMGWLFKQGGFVKNWKRRWFVLKDGKLSYYVDASRPTPLGVVDVRNAVVDACSSNEIQFKTNSNLFYFKVIPSKEKRIWYFGADTEDEMALWIRNIMKESCYDFVHSSVGFNHSSIVATSDGSSCSSCNRRNTTSTTGGRDPGVSMQRRRSEHEQTPLKQQSFFCQELDARPSGQLNYHEQSVTKRTPLQQQQQQQLGSMKFVASRGIPPPPLSSTRSGYCPPRGSSPQSFSSSSSSTLQPPQIKEKIPSEKEEKHFLSGENDTIESSSSSSCYISSKPIAFNTGITEVERRTMLEEVEKKKYIYTIDEVEKMMQLQQEIEANNEQNTMLGLLFVENPMEAQSFIVKFLLKDEYQMLLDAFEYDADAFLKKIIGKE